jgi:hypothetical protein
MAPKEQSAQPFPPSKDDVVSPADSRPARFEPLEVSDKDSDNEGSRRKTSWWKLLSGRATRTKQETQFYEDEEGEGDGLLDGADVPATRDISLGGSVPFSLPRLCKQKVVFCLMYVFRPTNHISKYMYLYKF